MAVLYIFNNQYINPGNWNDCSPAEMIIELWDGYPVILSFSASHQTLATSNEEGSPTQSCTQKSEVRKKGKDIGKCAGYPYVTITLYRQTL